MLTPDGSALPGSDTGLAQTITRAAGGDADAFRRIVEQHYDFIYRVAYRWAGNRADAEDLAQDVCIKLAQAIRGFDGRSAFSSWLYRITVNAARDMHRSRTRRARHVDAYAEVSPNDFAPDQEDGLAVGEIWDAIRALPAKQRDAMILVYAEGLSHAEAAGHMGCKEVTVSWHIHGAKKTLRALL